MKIPFTPKGIQQRLMITLLVIVMLPSQLCSQAENAQADKTAVDYDAVATPRIERMLDKFSGKLGLSEEQRSEVRAIVYDAKMKLEERKEAFKGNKTELKQVMSDALGKADAEIQAVLTSGQLKKYPKIKKAILSEIRGTRETKRSRER